MLLDGLSSSHPISQEVEQATDIDRVFDWIAYKKVRQLASSALANVCISWGAKGVGFMHVSVLTVGGSADPDAGSRDGTGAVPERTQRKLMWPRCFQSRERFLFPLNNCPLT